VLVQFVTEIVKMCRSATQIKAFLDSTEYNVLRPPQDLVASKIICFVASQRDITSFICMPKDSETKTHDEEFFLCFSLNECTMRPTGAQLFGTGPRHESSRDDDSSPLAAFSFNRRENYE
jgi:hypothetical protein